MHSKGTSVRTERRPTGSGASCHGMTLIELLVAMLAAGILVLTAGIMLVHVAGACRRGRDGISMQADGRVAMETIAKSVRFASPADIDDSQPGVLNVTVTGVTRRVYANGTELVFDPNIAEAGDLVSLVGPGRLTSFTVAKTNRSVIATLSMTSADNTHTETLRGVFTCRN